jgi:hypothetical protein
MSDLPAAGGISPDVIGTAFGLAFAAAVAAFLSAAPRLIKQRLAGADGAGPELPSPVGNDHDEGHDALEKALVETMLERLARVEAEAQATRQEIAAANTDRDILTTRLAAQGGELHALTLEVTQLKSENARLKQERNDALDRAAKLEIRVNDLERDILDMRVQVKAYELLIERLDVQLRPPKLAGVDDNGGGND